MPVVGSSAELEPEPTWEQEIRFEADAAPDTTGLVSVSGPSGDCESVETPTISLHAVSLDVPGDVQAMAAHRSLSSLYGDLHQCYLGKLDADGELHGSVELSADLHNGRLVHATALVTGPAKLAECVRDAISSDPHIEVWDDRTPPRRLSTTITFSPRHACATLSTDYALVR